MKLIFRILTCASLIFIFQFSIFNLAAQELQQGYFRNPMSHDIGLSATFGEFRTNHFHSGLDIRTGGAIGKPVYAAADGYVAEAYDGATATVSNLLGGSTSATAVSSLGDPVYVLYNDKFKRATSGTIPAGRAWLALGGEIASAGAPQFLTLNVVDNENTAIGTIMADSNDGDSWYTIDGLKVNGKPQRKGLYIKNGKKVFFNKK